VRFIPRIVESGSSSRALLSLDSPHRTGAGGKTELIVQRRSKTAAETRALVPDVEAVGEDVFVREL